MTLILRQLDQPLRLGLLTLCAAVFALSIGPAPVELHEVAQALLQAATGEGEGLIHTVVVQVRLPRILLALLVGSCLASCGALMQAMFNNPLADPGLIGVSSGASLGAALAIVAGLPLFLPDSIRPVGLPLAAALGGGFATVLVQRMGKREGVTETAMLLLSGLAIAALVNAVLGLTLHFADDGELRNLTFWLLGSLGSARPIEVLLAAPLLLLPVFMGWRMAEPLDALLLGEREAGHLGIDVETLKRRVIVVTAIGTGAAVALTGMIGFVGLVVPHLVRQLRGPSHSLLLPRAAWVGAGLLLIADTVARTVAAPVELPIGVLTALAGAPFFIWLIRQRKTWSQA